MSPDELKRAAFHLQVAANRYTDHAEAVCLTDVAESFRKQAADARYLSAIMEREVREAPKKRGRKAKSREPETA